ncbi:MAG: hypothetical protein D6796_11565, partial [Caldilineae bacterium]
TDTFWVLDTSVEPPAKFQVSARLALRTDHAYWWVQEGYAVPDADLRAAARRFEERTYPTNRHVFGAEWSPGIDGDPRLHILMGNIPGVSGYFSAANEYATQAVPHSNRHEMFFINLHALRPGQRQFDSVLAHEFQHMIHWHHDPNEDAWVNEGLSELAQTLNGFDTGNVVHLYLNQPDLQLTAWGRTPEIRRANYGASFLFFRYLYDRFGLEVIQSLVAQPENGIAGIEQSLQQNGISLPFDSIFADFLLANYLNDPRLDDGRWAYADPKLTLPPVRHAARHTTLPVEAAGTVKPYGADYIELAVSGPLSITFRGAMTTTLLPTGAHSGRFFWYGNRGDNSDSTLTRPVDLTGVPTATLRFWAWYDLEPDWDYAYIALSADDGATWEALPATTTTDTNPVGNAYGPGFTGQSKGWVEETVDLTPYAGQRILLRFEVVTDDAINYPGFAVDDIRLAPAGFADDAETDEGGWTATGFFRTDNRLPQRFIVQAIFFPREGLPVVRPMSLAEDNSGRLEW